MYLHIMNVFLEHGTTGLKEEAFLTGALDDLETLVTLEMKKDGSIMKGIIVFTEFGTIGFTTMMYESWNVLAILPSTE